MHVTSVNLLGAGDIPFLTGSLTALVWAWRKDKPKVLAAVAGGLGAYAMSYIWPKIDEWILGSEYTQSAMEDFVDEPVGAALVDAVENRRRSRMETENVGFLSQPILDFKQQHRSVLPMRNL